MKFVGSNIYLLYGQIWLGQKWDRANLGWGKFGSGQIWISGKLGWANLVRANLAGQTWPGQKWLDTHYTSVFCIGDIRVFKNSPNWYKLPNFGLPEPAQSPKSQKRQARACSKKKSYLGT